MTVTMSDNAVVSARLIFTDLSANNNKFWNGWVEGTVYHVHFGRVGEDGTHQEKDLGAQDLAVKKFESTKNSKIRKGYTEQKTTGDRMPVTVSVKATIESSQDKDTQKLIADLIKRNIHQIEDTTSIRLQSGQLATPLGPVTEQGIDEAERILHMMANARGTTLSGLANSYLRIVPRDIGRRKIDPADLFGSPDALRGEASTLDALRAILRDAEQQAKGEAPKAQTRLTLVDRDREALFQEIRALYKKGLNTRHTSAGMSLHRVWEMSIATADAQFEGPKLGNVRRLWHGTKDANLLSILKTGYVIPRSGGSIAVTGRMYGDGVYFSDQSTKSLNYATGYWGGGRSSRCFMLLNDVAMGREYRPTRSFGGGCPKGYDSTFAEAGRSGVMNNEMIVYRTSQIKPVFLCEFR